jgi:hypothetical protein
MTIKRQSDAIENGISMFIVTKEVRNVRPGQTPNDRFMREQLLSLILRRN